METISSHEEAKQRIGELVFANNDLESIQLSLRHGPLAGILSDIEIEQEFYAAKVAKNFVKPRYHSATLVRIFAIVVILSGTTVLFFLRGDFGPIGEPYSIRRHNPSVLAIAAVILGSILFIKPAWALRETYFKSRL